MIKASDGLWYRDLDARILGEGGMTDESYQRMVQFEVMRQQTVKHAAKKLFEQHAKAFPLAFLERYRPNPRRPSPSNPVDGHQPEGTP